jgi:type IV pilus assembly protein PilM
MAEQQAAWGIEIGQAGLKAIRLRYAEAADQVVAVAFDYVPHPKLLSQPDAVPDELIRQALATFLSRNQVGSDLVAIGLPGQSALAKFIQLPPVESSKVAEIVKYEARQQIPFPLEEVIWDYQTLGSGSEEGGFLLDAEVGLIAMKREQVNHHLKPFLERKIEVEAIQIAPLALYNFLCFDRLGIRPGAPAPTDNDYTVLLDMGADNTTLMVTNGRKIWIRNVPVGGNHFTRALTKEMKLTFAKAEHLKCNATKSPDPRAVFQALRPVFNDYVTEIQRSIGYFASVNRQAKIGRLIGCGNGFKLAGLQKFLQQNLQYEVERIDTFQSLAGDHVLHAPLFQDNILTFTVPYGLALQVLGRTTIQTTLLPPEIATARLIRRKKPWAAAAAAALLVGLSISTAGYGQVLESVSPAIFGKFESAAGEIDSYVKKLKGDYDREVGTNSSLKKQGDTLVTGLDTRELWLEVYKAIDECLPRDVGVQLDEADIKKMNRISIKSITAKYYEDLGQWFTGLRISDESDKNPLLKTSMNHSHPEVSKTPPSGAGYVFTLQGVHYHDDGNEATGKGIQYVLATLLTNLQKWEQTNIDPQTEQQIVTPVRKLGISHAVITSGGQPRTIMFYPGGGSQSVVRRGGFQNVPQGMAGGPMMRGVLNRQALRAGDEDEDRPFGVGNLGPARGAIRAPTPRGNRADIAGVGRPPGLGGVPGAASTTLPFEEEETAEPVKGIEIPEQEFVIQFVWKPTPVDQRPETDPLAPKKEGGDAPAGDAKTEEKK